MAIFPSVSLTRLFCLDSAKVSLPIWLWQSLGLNGEEASCSGPFWQGLCLTQEYLGIRRKLFWLDFLSHRRTSLPFGSKLLPCPGTPWHSCPCLPCHPFLPRSLCDAQPDGTGLAVTVSRSLDCSVYLFISSEPRVLFSLWGEFTAPCSGEKQICD